MMPRIQKLVKSIVVEAETALKNQVSEMSASTHEDEVVGEEIGGAAVRIVEDHDETPSKQVNSNHVLVQGLPQDSSLDLRSRGEASTSAASSSSAPRQVSSQGCSRVFIIKGEALLYVRVRRSLTCAQC